MERPGPLPLGFDRDRRAGGRLRSRRRTARVRGRGRASSASTRPESPSAPIKPRRARSRPGWPGSTLPFIRYDLGDEVTLLQDPCPCGSALAARRRRRPAAGTTTSGTAIGRSRRGSSGTCSAPTRVSPSTRCARRGPAPRSLSSATPDLTVVASAVEEALRRQGLAAPTVSVVGAAAIERHPTTGKLRRFVALDH